MITAISTFAAACASNGSFLGFPTWYEYLNGNTVNGVCSPQISGLTDIWLIVAAAIEILLRVAALAAVGFVIFGGVQFLTSQGEPDATNKARQTIINALIGLVIAVLAAVIVNFIAKQIS
jgi:ABC-type Fe3+ transport system permease subunit